MSTDDGEDIFDPIVDDIPGLINEQVESALLKLCVKKLKGIFLVGGFGSSQYLKARIEQEIPDVQLIQPDDA
ncbi:hypothetical protein GGR54DRAFT_636304 [Hypoxylon sp. NC1633]|nr:hypothetical protein GGR54DRAFT_636304 [Hypoxylon sp. NC1633]